MRHRSTQGKEEIKIGRKKGKGDHDYVSRRHTQHTQKPAVAARESRFPVLQPQREWKGNGRRSDGRTDNSGSSPPASMALNSWAASIFSFLRPEGRLHSPQLTRHRDWDSDSGWGNKPAGGCDVNRSIPRLILIVDYDKCPPNGRTDDKSRPEAEQEKPGLASHSHAIHSQWGVSCWRGSEEGPPANPSNTLKVSAAGKGRQGGTTKCLCSVQT